MPNKFNAGNHCGCCGQCFLQQDDFERADGPISGDWYGDGELLDGVLIADHDSTTICHPAAYTLGSLYATCLLKNCDPGITYKIRLGDPNATPDPIEVWVTFTGTVGYGNGTMTIELRLAANTVTESYTYDWENAEEGLKICYVPGLWLCAAPTIPREVASVVPAWVTTCLGPGGDDCWTRDGQSVGNWMFVEGEFDDFYMEVHYYERRACTDCDCYCVDETGFHCIPKEFSITVSSDDCLDGTYTMRQKYITDVDSTVGVSSVDYPEKYQWLSDVITCPANEDNKVRFVIRCNKDATYGYPRLEARVIRYPSYGCSVFQWDWDDPDTITPFDETNNVYDAYAWTKSGSDCDPLYLVLPDIIEDNWTCYNENETCCGAAIVFEDPPPPPPPPFRMSVVISE